MEPDYFRLFDGIDRIKVDIIELETSDDEDASEKRKASSPSKVLEKVKAYITENQLSADDGDSLWCVIDVDRWPQEQIEELHAFALRRTTGIWSSAIPALKSGSCITNGQTFQTLASQFATCHVIGYDD